MKNTVQFALALLMLAGGSIAYAQTQPTHPAVVSTGPGGYRVGKMPFRDESGKELTMKEVQALSTTGDYQVSRATDKNNKTYILVKKVPGFAPKPVAKPIVVKPGK